MIKFKTKYDSNIVKKSCLYAISQIIIPLVILAVIFFALGILNFVLSKNIVVGILWIVFSLIYIPVVYFVVYLTQTKKYKALHLKQFDKELELVDYCEFNEDFVLFSTLAEKEGFSKELEKEILSYSDFIKVKEKANEYIFTQPHSIVVIVPKSSLIEGTIEELNALLTKKYGDLFKKYAKNETNQENIAVLEPTNAQTKTDETQPKTEPKIVDTKESVEPENREMPELKKEVPKAPETDVNAELATEKPTIVQTEEIPPVEDKKED